MYRKYFTEDELITNRLKSIILKDIDIKSTKNKILGFISNIFLISSIIITVLLYKKPLYDNGLLGTGANLIYWLIKSFIVGSIIGMIPALILFGDYIINFFKNNTRQLLVKIDEILPNSYIKTKCNIKFKGNDICRLGSIKHNGNILYQDLGNDYFLFRRFYTAISSKRNTTSYSFNGAIIELPLHAEWLKYNVRVNSTDKTLGIELTEFPEPEDCYKLDFENDDFNNSCDVYCKDRLTATRVISPETLLLINDFRDYFKNFSIIVTSKCIRFAVPCNTLAVFTYSQEVISDLEYLVSATRCIRDSIK